VKKVTQREGIRKNCSLVGRGGLYGQELGLTFWLHHLPAM